MGTSDILFNMSRPTEQERTIHETSMSSASPFMGGAFIAFFLYIAMLVITFAVKARFKLVGILLLALGVAR